MNTSLFASRLFLALAITCVVPATGCALDAEVSSEDDGAATVGGRGNFDLTVGNDGDFYFTLRASNGAVLLSSEGYQARVGALGGMLSVLDNGGLETRYQVRTSKDGGAYLVLKAGNGQIIATSEIYADASSARRGRDASVFAVATYVDHWYGKSGARFEIFSGESGEYYFRLFSGNGAQVLRSEGYVAEASALNGAFVVSEEGVYADSYRVVETTSGYYFNIVAGNNQVVATSELYSTRQNAERARDAIIDLLPTIDLL